MFKKCALVSLVVLAVGSSAQAITFPEESSPFFYKSSTAYSSKTFDKIMQAYGLDLDISSGAADDLPMSYAASSDGKPILNNVPTAYTPSQYHDIFTSYGLVLTMQDVEDKLKVGSYAKSTGGEIIFGQKSIAYGGSEWENILSAYSLPMVDEVAVKMTPAEPEGMATATIDGDSDGDGVLDANDDCPNTPANVEVDDRGCWAVQGEVLFDFDKAVIKEEFYPVLDKTKKIFAAEPQLKVIVEGHTDAIGTQAYNQNLSERRAMAVKKYLVEKLGIADYRLKTIGYGEIRPAYSNETSASRAKNRRVEFTPVK